jgi:hypothetical protein
MKTKGAYKENSILIRYFYRIPLILIPFFPLAHTGCKKLVEVSPPSNITVQPNVFTDNATAIAAVTGIYTNMTNIYTSSTFSGNTSISLFSGLSADELTLYSGVTNHKHIGYYKNALSPNPPNLSVGYEHWSPLYSFIYKCNAAVEGLSAATTNALDPAVKRQLTGEVKFMRAFFYFYLVNLFGDVPLALTTDYKVNSLLPRSPTTQVYQQIIADLSDAQELLSSDYLDVTLLKSSIERVRPTKWAAAALLARVYLYTGNYAGAENAATLVINNAGLFSLPAITNSFLKNSNEAIWQLQPTTLYFNTEDARTFIIPSTGLTDGINATNPVYISPQLLNSFETGDQRAVPGNWINVITIGTTDYYFPYKYKNNLEEVSIISPDGMTEYLMVLRLGEQYLVRAEARAQLNNIGGAQSDLNVIRTRVGLGNTIANDKNSLLAAVLHERQVELFTEWGHRWLDLKRTGNIDRVMTVVTPLKANGAPWRNYQQWYPLPTEDLQKAPNLVQNPGY